MAIRSGRFGYSFTALRILQFLCFVVIVGLCAALTADIIGLDSHRQPAPAALALAASVVLATYVLMTVMGHLCRSIPYLANSIADIIAVIILMITAVFVGLPLTRLDCAVVGDFNEHIDSLGDVLYSVNSSKPDGIHKFIPDAKDKFQKVSNVKGLESVNGLAALGATVDEVKSKLGDYSQWVGRVENTCKIMKGVWGLAILLVFLFTATAAISYVLHRRVHSIRTFNVEENDDGSQVYHTQYVPASIMREASVRSDDRSESIQYAQRPSVDVGNQPKVVGREEL